MPVFNIKEEKKKERGIHREKKEKCLHVVEEKKKRNAMDISTLCLLSACINAYMCALIRFCTELQNVFSSLCVVRKYFVAFLVFTAHCAAAPLLILESTFSYLRHAAQLVVRSGASTFTWHKPIVFDRFRSTAHDTELLNHRSLAILQLFV